MRILRSFPPSLPCGLALLAVVFGADALAQFSPGELSRVHADLEGVTNCTQCHEIGAEISGAKCLVCHKEIRQAIGSGHGFHAATKSQRCVDCHKEHLGRNARTILSDPSTFDHARTGFALSGKHRALKCEDCHRPQFVRNSDVLAMMMERGRTSVLGLEANCSSCHADRHDGTLGTDCASCHSAEGWKPASGFDHARTAFPLLEKHAAVPCSKCHTAGTQGEPRLFEMSMTRYADCTPCHTSPHRQRLAETCTSCHSTVGWASVRSAAFNHDSTGFPLRGSHASVKCEQCHGQGSRKPGGRAVRTCAECHADYHKGEFLAEYQNDCSACHTVYGFTPSTFTHELHNRTRFQLTGAHQAILCGTCHRAKNGMEHVFHFPDVNCQSCHRDPHAGQFARSGKERCEGCHTTTTWRIPDYDHSSTGFDLSGRHRNTPCGECHRTTMVSGVSVAQYADLPSACTDCHQDPHLGQFLSGMNTTCSACHTSEGWPSLVFDHNTQSSFSLSGGHANVPCRSCHPVETIGERPLIRFKPLEKKCEHCHTGKVPNEG